MNEQIVYCVVFGLQVFSLSCFLPVLLIRRINYVFEHYPQEQYPKLYPKSRISLERSIAAFKAFNAINFIIGCFLVWGLLKSAGLDASQAIAGEDSLWQSKMLSFWYYLLQSAPFILLELFTFKLVKLMRENRTDHQRTAELKPRRLTHYANQNLLKGAIFSFVAFSITVVFLYTQPDQRTIKAVSYILLLLAGNAFFIGIIFWNLYGAKQDPYACQQDRNRRLRTTINSLLWLSISSSLYCVLIALADVYLDDFGSAILVSVFLQLSLIIGFSSLLTELGLKNANYETYR